MGYRMEYDMQSIRFLKTRKGSKLLRRSLLIVGCITGSLLLHFGSAYLEGILFGQGNAASVYAEEIALQLKDGASLKDAVEVFYTEVLK